MLVYSSLLPPPILTTPAFRRVEDEPGRNMVGKLDHSDDVMMLLRSSFMKIRFRLVSQHLFRWGATLSLPH